MRHFLLASLLFITAAAAAAPVTTGQSIAPFTIADQHDKAISVDQDVRLILFSRDMTANKLAKAAFLKKPGDFMQAHHAVYLIDVSGMPSFVTNNFAIPKMRKYGYRIFLDREGSLTQDLPARDGQVTLLAVDQLNVKSIAYATTPEALTAAVASVDAGTPATGSAP